VLAIRLPAPVPVHSQNFAGKGDEHPQPRWALLEHDFFRLFPANRITTRSRLIFPRYWSDEVGEDGGILVRKPQPRRVERYLILLAVDHRA
jgi:hypothetical protein